MLNRRAFIASLPIAGLAGRCLAQAAPAAEPLTLWGPPAAPSIILAQAVTEGLPKAVASRASFRAWKAPDEMRAGISSNTMAAVVVPTYVAANLYNRGLGLRLVNVLTNGLLSVVAPVGTVSDIASLKGKRLGVPFRNDMPDYICQQLLAAAGLKSGDLTIDYSGTPPEAVQMLLAGRVDAALLSEPATTAVIVRAGLAGKPLERAIDCQKAWASVAGRTVIPQAGLAVSNKLIERIGASGIAALNSALESALQTVAKDPATAARSSASALDLPAPLVERSIPFSNLVVRRASEARADLTSLFEILAKSDPRIIGGKQPDDGFYAL